MTTVTLEEAQARLPVLIVELQPGEEIVITSNGHPLARLRKAEAAVGPGKAGCYKKAEFYMAPDFDALLEEFKEYLE